jgi:competence protein ComEC
MNWWVLKRKIHTSWLVAIACGGIFIGVFAAQYVKSEWSNSFLNLIIAALIIIIIFWRRYVYLILVLIIGGMLLGLWRGSLSQNELAKFQPFYGKNISIIGMVKDDIDTGSSGQIVIRLDGVSIDKIKLPGVLYITSATEVEIKRGDELQISGLLKEGFGNFSGTMYRVSIDKIIHPQPGDIARQIRDWFADSIRRVIPAPESSLGIGFLVGQRRALPADLVLALQMVGLTHVVVASGYNLTILVRLARRLFKKISKYLSALSASLMIFSFIAITGLSPSMSRAGLVSALSLLAWYYGRKFHPIVLLLIAVAATVLINPSYAWGDLGWQLSFMSFAGVMILAPLACHYFFGDEKPKFIAQILIETMSAFIMTAPILIMAFGQLSNVSLFANLLVLPLVPLAMLLTFIAGIFSLILPFIGWIIAAPATWLLKYMIGVADYLAALPWAVSKIDMQWWGIGLIYLAISAACFYMWRVTKYNLREVNIVE